jgi:pre-mRNA-splicing factor ATP-dependent RNA helicase DHX15/PRP43
MASSTRHPFFDFLPRHVTANQVREVIVRRIFLLLSASHFLTTLQEGKENPFTRLPYSPQYHKLLGARKALPVFAQMDEFYEMVSPAMPFVCEGEIEPGPQIALRIMAMCR